MTLLIGVGVDQNFGAGGIAGATRFGEHSLPLTILSAPATLRQGRHIASTFCFAFFLHRLAVRMVERHKWARLLALFRLVWNEGG